MPTGTSRNWDLPASGLFLCRTGKYRKGKCEVTRPYAKWVPDETEEWAEDVESPPSGQWTLEGKTETIDAVQIWSVGPDGIDDGGLGVKGKGSDIRRTDDIRFIIPIR